MTSTSGIKLDDHMRERLKALGQLRDRSPHWLMLKAIEQYLDREEKYEREKREDEERWERYQLAEEAISRETVNEWLDDIAAGKQTLCPQ